MNSETRMPPLGPGGAFLVHFQAPDTMLELVEQITGRPRDGVIFTTNSLLLTVNGRGVRLTLGSSGDANALALAATAIVETMAETEQRATHAVEQAMLANKEAAGNA